MNLIDPANLPKSTTDGPESWGDAFSKLASTTSTAQQLIENTNSDRDLLDTIYSKRINTIEDLTGQKLENPIRSLPGVPGFLQPPYRAAYMKNEQDFNQRVQSLADQHPELGPQFQSLTGGVDDEMNRMRREAEQASGEASNDPTLDPISGFAAKMAGGLAGAARDPFQWQMAVLGGGGSAGGTVAARIGKTVVQEGLLNGGQEAVLQAASQQRKKAAGLEYGLKDALTNVGIAATFGALFGGTIEGGHALASIYKMGDGGAEVAARVIDGTPQPGDIETLAKAMNVDLHPDQISMVNRSFEDKTLDETFFPDDATPEQSRVVEAALRHAEDPDNHPPPEIVERAIADEQAGPARSLTADDYERIYGGDPDAIDDLHGVMQAESVGDAARVIDDQTRVPSEQTVAPENASPAADDEIGNMRRDRVMDGATLTQGGYALKEGENVLHLKTLDESGDLSLGRSGNDLKVGIASVSRARRGQGVARRMYEEAVQLADERGGALRSDIAVSDDAARVYESLARRGYDVRKNPEAAKTGKGWIAPTEPGKDWVFEVRKPRSAGEPVLPAPEPVDPYVAATERLSVHQVKDLEDRSVPEAVFHGTSSGEFDQFDPYRGEYGLMGAGSYFTENPHIALEYTKKGKGKSPAVYTTRIEAKRPMDMDGAADIDAWEKSFGEYFDRDNLPTGKLEGGALSNEQIYREVEDGLSQEMIPSYEGAEIMQDGLRSMGHDSVTHIGGGRHKASKDTKHRVWIVFDPEQTHVIARDRIGTTEPIPEQIAPPAANPSPSEPQPSPADLAEANFKDPPEIQAARDRYLQRQAAGETGVDLSAIKQAYEARAIDPLEGQTIKPSTAAEPVDDAAMRSAEEQAGAISDPAFDENGNPHSLLDFIPMQDRDGNFRLVSTAQALEMADRGNHFADLLEACKL